MLTLYLLQALVPLGLVLWIAVAPARSIVGFWAQASGVALGLMALGLTGLWLFPPWWTPHALGVVLIALMAARVLRRHREAMWPRSLAGRAVAACFAALAVFAADRIRLAAQAMRIPSGEVAALSWPLGPGRYLVANGGATLALNAHADALDQSVAAHRPWRGTAWGVDIVAIDGWGLRADGLLPRDPARYRIFGAPVLAPCAGAVIVAVDGLPDMAIPEVDADHLAGNHVILRCGDLDVVLAHFSRGSVMVRKGDRLEAGARIAEVGNSGASSEPHLHIHAQTRGAADMPFGGAPVPLRLAGRIPLRNERVLVSSGR